MQRRGGGLQDVLTLFDSGTTVGMTDGELLVRFAERPDRTGDGPDAAGSAFAALVQRHGPMVLRVCRSILRDEHDAQDAFQATFLVLVRRARAVRRQGSVGSWLHGVALRVSARARADLARRRRHERRGGESRIAADRSDNGEMSPETAAIIHEELGRLPERYRRAVVLCYLEGHTCEAAARRLGWPVGTVKSRLARGRERLRGRLIRRGLAPDEASSLPALAGVIPAALARDTIEGMLRFGAGRPTAGATTATALSWTYRTLRTMQMTRIAILLALLIAGLAATGAAKWTALGQKPAETRSTASSKAARDPEPAKPAEPESRVNRPSVRVVDITGRGVPDVVVKVVEFDAIPADDGPGYRIPTHPYRTGADGRFRVDVHPLYRRIILEARPDDRTLGWASLDWDRKQPKATDDDPLTLTLLPRDHLVEGTIRDGRGTPLPGVVIRTVAFNHRANGSASDRQHSYEQIPLGSAVTDEAGRYRISVPAETTAVFQAYHHRFVGPSFHCKPDERVIPPVTLEDAGGIIGTVIDAATGQPVSGARIGAERIEHTERILNNNYGGALSDTQGRFEVGGLAPGVYNLVLESSPKGRRFLARAVEGVRVKAGEDIAADLRMIEGRRLRGRAVSARTGKTLIGAPIVCRSTSHPRSGNASQSTCTDEQGRFEHFVLPGPALVYIAESGQFGREFRRIVNVPDDRDPEPVLLRLGDDPNTKEPPGADPPFAGEVRVRVKSGADDRPAPGEQRVLTGRVFDKTGSLLVGVQVYDNRSRIEAATDRLGVFRLKGLSRGKVGLDLYRNREEHGWAELPAEAVEIDLIFP